MGRYSNKGNKRTRHRMQAVERKAREDAIRQPSESFIERLPPEMVGTILSFLPLRQLPALLRVCWAWHDVLVTDEALWRRWFMRYMPDSLIPAKGNLTWPAFFRQCAERRTFPVYNLNLEAVEVVLRGCGTLTDLLDQINALAHSPGTLRKPQERMVSNTAVFIKTVDGEWNECVPDVPLYCQGLHRGGQRISISWRLNIVDLDFHNLDRHSRAELEGALQDLVGFTPKSDWSKQRLIDALSNGKPSQFESPYAHFEEAW